MKNINISTGWQTILILTCLKNKEPLHSMNYKYTGCYETDSFGHLYSTDTFSFKGKIQNETFLNRYDDQEPRGVVSAGTKHKSAEFAICPGHGIDSPSG